MKRIAYFGVGTFSGSLLLVSLLALPAVAQTDSSSQPTSAQGQSGSSLGDYARQIKKDGAPAKARPKVFDNDNLPTEDKLSVIGEARPATTAQNGSDNQSAQANGSAASSAPKSPAEEAAAKKAAEAKQWQDKIDVQKGQIDLAARELDVTQREYQLRAAAMYADAGNRMRNEAEWDKEDAQYKQQIADKQKALDDAKAKLDDIQEGARKAGAEPPANPAPATTAAAPQQ
ncbi:MAG: hypothetical protein WBQ08_12540 [Candidatus Sulfotelmatobacter sp.]